MNKSIILSFDDGYSDIYTYARSHLTQLAGRVIIFPVVGRIGSTNDWDFTGELKGRKLLSWNEISDLRSIGWEIGSHSLTHADLTKLGDRELERETRESRRILEERLGEPVEGFAYPFGYFNEKVIRAVNQAGYKWAVTTSDSILEGFGNPYRMRRINISGLDPAWLLRAKLSGLYDIKACWGLPKLISEKIGLTLKGKP